MLAVVMELRVSLQELAHNLPSTDENVQGSKAHGHILSNAHRVSCYYVSNGKERDRKERTRERVEDCSQNDRCNTNSNKANQSVN